MSKVSLLPEKFVVWAKENDDAIGLMKPYFEKENYQIFHIKTAFVNKNDFMQIPTSEGLKSQNWLIETLNQPDTPHS